MGNCLDLPQAPPKDRNAPKHHANGTKHRPKSAALSQRSRTYSADSFPRMQDSFSPYQATYPPYYEVPPPRSLVLLDPNTGQAYAYPPSMPPPVPMTPYPYPYGDGYYDYYDNGDDYGKEPKRSRHHKKKENGDLDKNGNRRSTLITTFPDPSDDVIIHGDDAMPSRVTVVRNEQPQDRSSPKPTTAVSERSSQSIVAVVNNSGGDQVDVGDVQLRPKHPDTPPLNQHRGSTYVTYIKDVPVAAPTEVVEDFLEPQDTIETYIVDTDIVDIVEAREPMLNGEVNHLLVDEAIVGERHVINDGPTTTDFTTTLYEGRTFSKLANPKSSSLFRGGPARLSVTPVDVVVVGTACDVETIRRIKNQLESCGLACKGSVVDPGRSEDESTLAGQLIVEAKIMVLVLSVTSVQSGPLRDEVSLARVSSTAIFPVAVDQPLDILDNIDMALKLQVAGYKWAELRDPERPSDLVLDLFVNSVREELEFINSNPDVIDEDYGQVSNRSERRHNTMRRRHMTRMIDLKPSMTAPQYWDRTYGSEPLVEWSRFRRDFTQQFRGHLDSLLPRAGQLQAMDCLRRELIADDSDMTVHRALFVVFCNDDGQDEDLWEKFINLARENLAIRDVFDVESTVRIVAIQNIGRFDSPAVLNSLRNLLSDPAANIRAVATVSLSRCIGPSDELSYQLLRKSLDDSDRLVRQAGCLAMGYLKVASAVPKLAHMWRNDVISHVREAAQAALEEIGGADAREEMRVTRILADEIRALS